MKVTTIDGGFRGRKGVGSLTTAQVLDEVEAFEVRLAPFRQAVSMARQRIAAGGLPVAEAREIEAAASTLEGLIDQHIAASSQVASSSDLLAWRNAATLLVSRAQAFVTRAGTAVQAEAGTRPWKIALGLVIGSSVVSLLVWGLAQVQRD